MAHAQSDTPSFGPAQDPLATRLQNGIDGIGDEAMRRAVAVTLEDLRGELHARRSRGSIQCIYQEHMGLFQGLAKILESRILNDYEKKAAIEAAVSQFREQNNMATPQEQLQRALRKLQSPNPHRGGLPEAQAAWVQQSCFLFQETVGNLSPHLLPEQAIRVLEDPLALRPEGLQKVQREALVRGLASSIYATVENEDPDDLPPGEPMRQWVALLSTACRRVACEGDRAINDLGGVARELQDFLVDAEYPDDRSLPIKIVDRWENFDVGKALEMQDDQAALWTLQGDLKDLLDDLRKQDNTEFIDDPNL